MGTENFSGEGYNSVESQPRAGEPNGRDVLCVRGYCAFGCRGSGGIFCQTAGDRRWGALTNGLPDETQVTPLFAPKALPLRPGYN
jgi:hypothetical protein